MKSKILLALSVSLTYVGLNIVIVGLASGSGKTMWVGGIIVLLPVLVVAVSNLVMKIRKERCKDGNRTM